MTDLRVLIVEDDHRIADLHRRFTEKMAGFEVVGIASDYSDAAEQAHILKPDLILLDLYLPEGNGLDLLLELRGQDLILDESRYSATLYDKEIELTAVEFKLLHILVSSPGRIFSRNQLMDRIYPDERIVSDRTIDALLGEECAFAKT